MEQTAALRAYVHRYTMEHVPEWAKVQNPGNGKYYAPQFRTDSEWYQNTDFPPHPNCIGKDCHTSGQTWPLGKWLDTPYEVTK